MNEIRLRALEPEDLDVLYDIENDLDLWSVGYTTVPYSRYLLHDYIANSQCDIYADRQVRLVVEMEDGSDVVGIVDITDFEPRHNRAELGLVVRKKYRNMGFGGSVVRKMIDYSREVIHLHQLYVVIDSNNTSCIDLFKNYGFKESHCLEDWLYDGEKYRKAVFLTLFL